MEFKSITQITLKNKHFCSFLTWFCAIGSQCKKTVPFASWIVALTLTLMLHEEVAQL